MPFVPNSTSIHDEFNLLTSTEDAARSFMLNRGLLKQMNCNCSAAMELISCSSTKSADLLIWKCPSCKKFKNIRSDSVLAGSKLSFKQLLTLVYYFSFKSLTNTEVSAATGLSDKAGGIHITVTHNTR